MRCASGPVARRLWAHPLVAAKSLLARFFLLIEFCHRCGKKQPIVWHASDAIWERYRDGYNVLCPDCFHHLAERGGVRLQWEPQCAKRGPTVWVPHETRLW